jgi:2-phosphosulfolactate phosphatase
MDRGMPKMAVAACEWGLHGARKFAGRVGALVIVDVLSFSTCVDIAVARGAQVLPFAYGDAGAARAAATALGAEVAGPRGSREHRFSLSPASFLAIAPGTRLVLPSPNGSAISAAACTTPVLTGCLRNARAVARRAAQIALSSAVAVIPAGERWSDGSLRPAIEDLIGAGAILEELGLPCSPEAELAAQAFRSARPRLAGLVRGSVSGQELIARGYPADVELATELNASDAAPLLVAGAYVG